MTRIALVQLRCEKGDIEGNLAAIARETATAAAAGADLVAFPEMSITGYINDLQWPAAVLRRESPEVARLAHLSAHHGISVIAGLVEHNPLGKPYIVQAVAQAGSITGWYRKCTIPADEQPFFSAGSNLCLFDVRGTRAGLAICADIDNPGHFQQLAAAGARLVVECAAPGLYGEQANRDWASGYAWWRQECHTKLGSYARRFGITIAVTTQAGRTIDEDFPGGGYVFGRDGRCLAESADWRTHRLMVTLLPETAEPE